jgi:hypothetical protein
MKKLWGAVFVSSFAVACGGGNNSKGADTAAAASASGASQISMNFPVDAQGGPAGSVDLSGPAFSQYDPDAKALLIYVLDPATTPAPSCDTVGLPAMMKQTSGAVAAVVIKDFSGAASKVKGGLGMFVKGDATKQQDSPHAVLDATSVDITTYDAKTIEASITTDASSKATVTGKIHGTVCPNTSMQKQAQQVQDDMMAKAQANGGGAFGAAPAMPGGGDGPSYDISFVTGDSISGSTIDTSHTLVRFDPKTKTLVVGSWTPNLPPPTCDLLAAPAKAPATTSGTVTMLYAKGVTKHAAGKFSVFAAQQMVVGDPSADKPMSGAKDGWLDVHTFDDKSFAADVQSAGDMAPGKIAAATVCPNGHVDVPAVTQPKAAKPAKGGKKK